MAKGGWLSFLLLPVQCGAMTVIWVSILPDKEMLMEWSFDEDVVE